MQCGHDRTDRHVRPRCPRPPRRLAARPACGEQEPGHRGRLRRRRHPLPALVQRARSPADEPRLPQPVGRWHARRRSGTRYARIRQQAVRRFAAWLTAGGELHADPFPGVKAPRVEPPLVEPLTDAELRALIRTCAVPDADLPVGKALHHRRDEAIIRLMFETAIRSGELINLQLADVDLVARLVTIHRGKEAEAGSSQSARPRPRRSSATSVTVSSTPSLPRRTCGWAAAASGSAVRASPAPYAAEQSAPKSRASDPTGSATPPPTAGSQQADQSPASWPSPAEPAPTCSSATPAPTPGNEPPAKPAGSIWGSSDLPPAAMGDEPRLGLPQAAVLATQTRGGHSRVS